MAGRLDAAPLTLGTAGHIDHGKTALIEALTGRNTDRLAEERRRGISIELGFAQLPLPDGRSLSVVDVPGHERFVRSMVAGATGIDLFLMAVAADDGVMPQTREHWAVLRALGVEEGVTALTKCDLVDAESRRRGAAEARQLIPGIPLVEVSAPTRQGLCALLETLAQVAARVASRRRQRPAWPYPQARLHVDRVFSLHGIGTVVTGTLWSGEIGRGDRVEILPVGKVARVRSVQVHDRPKESAEAGQRVALSLAGVGRRAIERGAVIASQDSGLRPTYRLDVELRLEPWAGEIAGKRVHVHHGTRATPARVVVLDETGELAQLRLEAPLIGRAGDRFVLRSIAKPDTLGGGAVLDPRPRRHGPGPATQRLKLIRDGEAEALLEAALRQSEDGLPENPRAWTSSELLAPALHRFPLDRWRAAEAALLASGRAVTAGDRLLAPAAREAGPRGPSLEERRRHALSARAQRALQILDEDGARPRDPRALADSLGLERREALVLLEELVEASRLVRLKPTVYYPRGHLDRLREEVLELIRERASISIAELRDELGTSRKYAQALLEHLDSTKETVRRGDRHVLRRHRPEAVPGGGTLGAGRQGSGGPAGLQSQ